MSHAENVKKIEEARALLGDDLYEKMLDISTEYVGNEKYKGEMVIVKNNRFDTLIKRWAEHMAQELEPNEVAFFGNLTVDQRLKCYKTFAYFARLPLPLLLQPRQKDRQGLRTIHGGGLRTTEESPATLRARERSKDWALEFGKSLFVVVLRDILDQLKCGAYQMLTSSDKSPHRTTVLFANSSRSFQCSFYILLNDDISVGLNLLPNLCIPPVQLGHIKVLFLRPHF